MAMIVLMIRLLMIDAADEDDAMWMTMIMMTMIMVQMLSMQTMMSTMRSYVVTHNEEDDADHEIRRRTCHIDNDDDDEDDDEDGDRDDDDVSFLCMRSGKLACAVFA